MDDLFLLAQVLSTYNGPLQVLHMNQSFQVMIRSSWTKYQSYSIESSFQEVELDVVPSALCENLGEDLSVVVERETCAGKRVRRGVNRFLARRTEQDLVFEDLKGKEGACIGHLCQDTY